jgi:hypothetical protein
MSAAGFVQSLVSRGKLLKKIFWVWLAGVALFDIFLPRHGSHEYLMDWMPLFWTIFGALGCLLLVFVGKGIFKPIFRREEDYYRD